MSEQIRYELIAWSTIQNLCLRLATLIQDSGFKPDMIVTIARGGYVPARLLCDHLHIMDLTSIKIEHYLSLANKEKQATIRYPLCIDIKNLRVLLVDDVNDSGDTLALALEHLRSFQPAEVRTAVMHHKLVSHFTVDYYAAKVTRWRWLIYPWAVTEDVSSLLHQLSPLPANLEQAQQQLNQQLGLHMSRKKLAPIYNQVKDGLIRCNSPSFVHPTTGIKP